RVGDVRERRALLERQRCGGNAEDRDEHDDREQIAVRRGLEWIGRYQLRDELRTTGNVFGGALDRAHVGASGGAERELLLGSGRRVWQDQRTHQEPEGNADQGGRPEERQRP